jgi:hypothetical protein
MRTINKQPKKQAYIFSVHQSGLTSDLNRLSHIQLLSDLKNHGVAHKEVEVRCKYKGLDLEKSVYVQTNDNYNEHELYEYVKNHCINANQESFLDINPKREAILVYLNGKTQSIGVLSQVSKLEALNIQNYTYDIINDSYFTTE